jgi:hypothetical protein
LRRVPRQAVAAAAGRGKARRKSARIGDGKQGVRYDNCIMADTELLRRKLEELRLEHRDLDDVISRLAESAPMSQIQLQRLKKRKLMLKDQIARLESRLLPDIIA